MTVLRRAFQLFALFATLLAPNATLASNEARVVCQIALAVIGFDAGLLHSPDAPVFHRQDGEPDWGGPAWRQPTDPAHWMAASVVWYSQRLTRQLGARELARYVSAFDYGNHDLSGGLGRAWLSSSLTLSPRQFAVARGRPLAKPALDSRVIPLAVWTALMAMAGSSAGLNETGKPLFLRD